MCGEILAESRPLDMIVVVIAVLLASLVEQA